MKTGVERWVKSGQMPTGRGFEKVKRYIRDVEIRLIDALGGVKTITPQQEILIRGTIKALGVCYLVELYINREGPVIKHLLKRGIVELQPCLGKSYLAFLNTIRQNVTALGLERRKAEKILDLTEYVKAHDARQRKAKGAAKSAKQPGEGQASRLGQGGNGSDKQGQDSRTSEIKAPGSTSSDDKGKQGERHE
jgi:hypothetical protein